MPPRRSSLSPACRGLFALVLLAGCESPVGRFSPGDGDTNQGGDGGDAGGDGTTPTCRSDGGYIALPGAQTLDPLVEDQTRCLVYGADRSTGTVFVIDTALDVVRATVAVGAEPLDLTLSSDRRQLYVAVFGLSQVVVLDAQSGGELGRHLTTLPPYRIARGVGDRLYYVEETAYSAIRELNLVTGDDTQLTGVIYHEPDLEASSDGTRLYVGEANQPGSRLLRLDATQAGLPERDQYEFTGGFTQPSPERRIFLADLAHRIYFADRAFDADDLGHMRGWLGQQVVAATDSGSILASREFLFDGETHVSFANRPHGDGGAVFSSDGQVLYEFSATGSLLYRTPVSTLLGVHELGETQVPPGSLAQHRFTQLVADTARPVIYAIDSQQNQLVFIDRATLVPVRAEIIGSAPTDMAVEPANDQMVIATFGATEVAVIDLNSTQKALKSVLRVPGNPFHITINSDGEVVYAEQDQVSDVTLLHLNTGVVLDSAPVFQADVEFDASGRYLYAGESAGPDARLRRYDLINNELQEIMITPGSYAYPMRKVIFSQGAIFYAGRKFDASTLAELGDFGDELALVTPDGRHAASRRLIYDTQSFLSVGGLPIDSGLLAVSPDSTQIYQFDNDTGTLFVQDVPGS